MTLLARRHFTAAMTLVGGSLFALAEAGAQQNTGYFIGHSHSWGARAFVLCEAHGCFDAVEMSHRPLTSMVLGMERGFRDDGAAHISVGASVARGGWYEGFGRWTEFTTVSVPIMLIGEPFGADAPFGVSLGAGVSGDFAINEPPESRLSLTGGAWAYAGVTKAFRLSLGVRTSRTVREVDGLHLRSHVFSLGFSTR